MNGSNHRMIIQVPTPGDHYSQATGSATISVIHEMNRKHLEAGGQVRIVVGKGTMHDIPEGQCVEVDFPGSRSSYQKLVDTGLGWAGLSRIYECQRYRPALSAVEPDFDGAVLVYNGPSVIGQFRKHCRRATVCLYAVNALFRSYSRGEARRIVESADRIICCSKFIADDLIQHIGKPSLKIKTVHNGVDTTRFVPMQSQREQSPVKILFIGRATPQKGPDLLLKAAQLLAGKTQPFKVRLVGSKGFAPTKELSPYEQVLRELAEPIREYVEFQPSIARSQLLQEYHGASIFCAPSNWDDPFPLTVLEAQASGIPVVASRRGGIPEGGADNILFFDPPNVEELAERLRFFIENPVERAKWAARGRVRAESLDWKYQYQVLQAALSGR